MRRPSAFAAKILTAVAFCGGLCAVPAGAEGEGFPAPRPATRAQAEAVLSAGGSIPIPCLTTPITVVHRAPQDSTAAGRLALGVLQDPGRLPGELREPFSDGTVIVYTTDPNAFDRVDPADRDADGRPDVVEAVREALARARADLARVLDLDPLLPVTVMLARTAPGIDGYVVPEFRESGPGSLLVVVNAGIGSDPGRAARATTHQYAHALLLAQRTAVPPAWAEAIATWAELRAHGVEPASVALLNQRIARSREGLDSDDLALAAGNALWLAFLEHAYGAAAVARTAEELAVFPDETGLERGIARATGLSLERALREYQIWTLLVGERSNGRHLPFAGLLQSPTFSSDVDGLPSITVQSDPPVDALGLVAVRLRPDRDDGGMTVLFEGEFSVRWEADVLLVSEDGALHRVEIPLSRDARGEVTVPVGDLSEAILLVRNVDRENGAPHRFTWAAFPESDFPFALTALDASPIAGTAGGVLVSWETRSEHRLIGFNVRRVPLGGGIERSVNPVWVPAIGAVGLAASYQFLDRSAEPGRTYEYRIEGITYEGLASASEPVFAGLPRASD